MAGRLAVLTDVVFQDVGLVGEGPQALFLVVGEVPGQGFAEKILTIIISSVLFFLLNKQRESLPSSASGATPLHALDILRHTSP